MCNIFIYLFLLLVCLNNAEWIKIPEIDMEHKITNEPQITSHKTWNIDEGQQFIRVNVENNPNTVYHNFSLSQTENILITTERAPFDKKINVKNPVIVNSEEKFITSKRNTSNAHIKNVSNQEQTSSTFKNKQSENNSSKEEKHRNKSDVKDDFKVNDFSHIIRSIQQTVFANIPKALKGKLAYLKVIHDNILINIEQQMSKLWPLHGTSTSTSREKRGVKGDEQHVDFPSSEMALMTISFLTFAVFLVKLVMQLINVLKTKKMAYNPMVTAMGRSLPDMVTPGFSDETSLRILQMMEDFKHN